MLRQNRIDLNEAHNRLYGAWQDHAVIPPAPKAPSDQPIHPKLPDDVVAWLQQWDEAGRGAWRRRAEAFHEKGFSSEIVIAKLEAGEMP